MYGFSAQLKVPYERAVAKVTEALKGEGFGVVGVSTRGSATEGGQRQSAPDRFSFTARLPRACASSGSTRNETCDTG